jgi:hypothetical protein
LGQPLPPALEGERGRSAPLFCGAAVAARASVSRGAALVQLASLPPSPSPDLSLQNPERLAPSTTVILVQTDGTPWKSILVKSKTPVETTFLNTEPLLGNWLMTKNSSMFHYRFIKQWFSSPRKQKSSIRVMQDGNMKPEK